MKQLTGGDPIRARKLFRDNFQFDPTHKVIIAGNNKPVVRGTDHGNWRRIRLVPWTVTIGDDEKDKHLPAKLKAELPGILNWAMQGCLDWQRHGLGEPEEVKVATDTYRAEQDTVAGFVAECCHAHPTVRANPTDLHNAYVGWSGDKQLTLKAFGDRLETLGYPRVTGSGNRRYHQGLGLPQTEPSAGFGKRGEGAV
jgi:putative DNA primase/helicase